ncbi:MAG: DUF6338 family protein, partial [Candidatus Hydrogenedentes bacterium]|nr:DUF6338 family protein [Candidatus Hydrogenedentota bacterium]
IWPRDSHRKTGRVKRMLTNQEMHIVDANPPCSRMCGNVSLDSQGFNMSFSAEDLSFILIFILPGFILQSTVGAFVPQSKETGVGAALQFLKLSLFNLAVCFPLIYLLRASDFFLQNANRSLVAWFAVLVIVPSVIGVGLGLLHQKNILRSLVQLVGFSMTSPIPTSWDYIFSKTPAVWVLVTLKDGSQVGGLWGSDSFASSNPNERDLYIERVFKVAQDGQWKEISRSSGILIQGEDIRHIEFYEV